MTLQKRKIFGIGLGKTGTLSLANALKMLGYKTGHYAEALSAVEYRNGRLEPLYGAVDQWDALADIPIAATYKLLDKAFPGSKFILTVREEGAWLASSERHNQQLKPSYFEKNSLDPVLVEKVRDAVLGQPPYERQAFIDAYQRHLDDVVGYFRDRPEDLAILDICGGDGWEPMCKFLGRDAPKIEFPYRNRRSTSSTTISHKSAQSGTGRAVAGALKRLDTKSITISEDDILGFTRLKDDNLRLPWWLEYHRRLGVNRFFIVDNASSDGSIDYLLKQNDVYLFSSEESYDENTQGMVWVDSLLDQFGTNKWCLFTDPDELFYYPHIENVSLKKLTDYLDSRNFDTIRCGLIDMYSALPLSKVQYNRGNSFIDTCNYFDSELDFKQRLGPRKRLFWAEDTGTKPPAQLKSPLFRWRKGWRHKDAHLIENLRHADICGALLHFKFFQDFKEKVDIAIESGQYHNSSIEYEIYKNSIASNSDVSFFYEGSEKLEQSKQLIKPGVMKSSSKYENYSISKYRFIMRKIMKYFGKDV